MAQRGEREPVGGQAFDAAEREQRPGERERRGGGDRERQWRNRRREGVAAVGGQRGCEQEQQLAGGEAEGEPVFELDVGG